MSKQRYHLNQSPLYKVGCLRSLAATLSLKPQNLRNPKYKAEVYQKLLSLEPGHINQIIKEGDKNYSVRTRKAGSFEKQVGALVNKVFSAKENTKQKKKAIDAINYIFEKNTAFILNYQCLDNKKQLKECLIDTIQKIYPNDPAKLQAFLQDVQKPEAGLLDSNPLKIYKSATGRVTEVPFPLLKLLHTKLNRLLSRIEPPTYLFSATKKKSYVSNGAYHANSQPIIQIDIRNFFPSTHYNYIYHFFRNIMRCSKDIASILAKICVYQNHLPTGSPISPLLSFYAHMEMFDKINMLAQSKGCTMSVYVDDIVISGEKASKKLQREVMIIIASHNLRYHTRREKAKLYRKNTPKRVTGTIIVGNKIKLRNKSHKEIHDDLIELSLEKDLICKQKKIQKLLGKVNEATQFDDSFHGKAEHLKNMQKNIKKQLKQKKQAA